ncbi:MAG: metallophosphoesterase, partial [Planctomycetaceae bacterium]
MRPPWRRQSGLTWLLTWLLTWALGGWSCVAGWSLAHARAEEPAVTFFATSDSHYEALEKLERNDRNRVTLRRMNELPGQPWPDALGGDPIDKPRGVLVLGDLIDDGDRQGQTEIEWNHFENQFGLDGSDGLLKFPVFEGWGNHDGPPAAAIKHGFSVQQQIRQRNLRRLDQKLISHVAPNQLHYSWDWNGVHFIQANLYPADRQHPKVRYSLPWHDPQLALQFVREDLAAHVGDSGRPVIIMAHCGFDTDWWVADDWNAFHEAIAPYNVVAYFHGHSGTGIRKWQPAEGGRPLQVVNTGQTERGFFVAQVSSTRLRVAFQVKRNAAGRNAGTGLGAAERFSAGAAAGAGGVARGAAGLFDLGEAAGESAAGESAAGGVAPFATSGRSSRYFQSHSTLSSSAAFRFTWKATRSRVDETWATKKPLSVCPVLTTCRGRPPS